MALISRVILDVMNDIAHTKSGQRLEQDIEGASYADPRTEVVKFSQNNRVFKQTVVQIQHLRRDELTVFIARGNAPHPKIVDGCTFVHHECDRATKFATHAEADGL